VKGLLGYAIVDALNIQDSMTAPLESLPRRIFLDSCTVQTLRDYGGFIYEGEPIPDDDRIHRVTDGYANLEALREIFLVNERAMFEWIVSEASLQEAVDKQDRGHLRWLYDIADHTQICLEGDGPTPHSEVLARRIYEPCFGYLSAKDRELLRQAISLRCEAFLTMEQRLPRNAAHIGRELGIRVLTPIVHWQMLRPWAPLWL
jgi:hypothetical protein